MSARDKNRGTLAIVGRPNVGKSAIFNRLAGSRIAIVHDEPGVTRDRISTTCRKGRFPFTIMDTGGICSSLDDGFTEQVETEAEIALASAEAILFVVDAQDGVTSLDEAVAALLRKSGAHIILGINKVDTDAHASVESDFARLGFNQSVNISAAHGRGFHQLLDTICENLTAPPEKEEAQPGEDPGDENHPIKIALVGRPNVGKSSLVNAILDDARTIVSEVAGTTRDAVDIPHMRDGAAYTLIDTAGMRRRSKRDTAVEAFSVMRAEKSIERSDICLLVIDAARGVTAMDRTISQQIMKQGKACIVLLNKFDLYHPDGSFKDRMEELSEHVSNELFFVHYAPMVAVSALKGQYIGKIFSTIERVRDASRHSLNTAQITQVLRDAVRATPPPAKHGKALNLLYATHASPERPSLIPTPAYLLFVNDAALVPENYQRFLETKLRKANPCTGLPIRFFLRDREKRKRTPSPSSNKPRKRPAKKSTRKPARKRGQRRA